MAPPQEIRVHVIDYGRTNLYMRYTDPTTGAQVARSTGKKTAKEAERAAAVWESELRAGQYKPDGRIPWGEFRQRYNRQHCTSLKPAARRRIEGVLAMFERTMKPATVSDVTAQLVAEYQSRLRAGEVSEPNPEHPDGPRSEDTIATHTSVIKAALQWAFDLGYIRDVPRLRQAARVRRKSKSKPMKGRPIDEAEMAEFVAAVPKVLGVELAAPWQRYLRGLRLSGLRLEESLVLSWDDPTHLMVDLSGRRPVFLIEGDAEKGGQTRILPMAPEFADFLEETPAKDRRGLVFKLPKRKKRGGIEFTPLAVGRIISSIGKTAGIVVDLKSKKTVSAHDLRRTFGSYWATRVMPQVLMELMRHADISTTLKYYIGANAHRTADVLWDVHEKEKASPKESEKGNTPSNTPLSEET